MNTQRSRAALATRTYTGSRASVAARDQESCVVCGRPAVQTHHRRPRKAGGSSGCWWINLPANLISLCGMCHRLVESERDWAGSYGYLVTGSQVASEVPVKWFGDLVLLDNDGGHRTLTPHTQSG